MRVPALRASLLVMGVSGNAAQIILLRELLVSFLGNELVLGIILANWLILEAAGSFLVGRTAETATGKAELFVLLQLLFSIALPLAVHWSRTFKTLLTVSPGQAVGFAPILACSFAILMPVSVPHGALFTCGSKLHSLAVGGDGASTGRSVGRVYILETLGSIAGGLLLTFLLIQRLHSFAIAFALSLANALVSLALLGPGAPRRPGLLNTGLRCASILLAALYSLVLFSPLVDRIHAASIETQWSGLRVTHTQNSIYGNITVIQTEEQAAFFADGVLAVTTPVPDVASLEDFVHFALLLHRKPGSILILGGGAGGMIREVLKHGVERVDYVELDPLLLQLIERYGSGPVRQELADSRVRTHNTDGRLFVTRTDERYDIVLVGLGPPQELQINRLFSKEFFLAARERMRPEGMIVLSLPGSLTYLSEELRKLNACILHTLQSVFAHVRVIPGDVNLYLASDSETLARASAGDAARRLEERRISAGVFTSAYIRYRLEPERLRWYEQALEGTPQHVNSDSRPLAVFYSLSHWNALFSPSFARVFKAIEGTRLPVIAAAVAAVTAVLAALFAARPAKARWALPLAIGTTGFCGMVFDLAVIFTFQTVFGCLYHQIGLLVTVFMAGAATGSFSITRRLDRISDPSAVFVWSEGCLVCFSLLLPFALLAASRSFEKPSAYALLYGLFLATSFVSGLLTGIQFPLAARMHLAGASNAPGLAHTAGLLYAADLVGGYFGGLAGGVVLLPILGLPNTCSILAMIKAGSLLLVLLHRRSARRPEAA